MALKQFLSVSLAALTAAATPGGPAFPSAPPGDGAPTQESCAALGFPQAGGYEDRAPALPAYAPPPPPSPRISPPPPAPSIAQPGAPASVSDMSVQELVVTSSHRERRAQGGSVAGALGKARPAYTSPGLPVETERYPNAVTNPIRQVAEAPVSTFSVDVDTAAYANVRRFLNEGRQPPTDAARVEELVNYFDYDYP